MARLGLKRSISASVFQGGNVSDAARAQGIDNPTVQP